MAEAVGPGQRSQKEDIFVHHHFHGSYHRSENMVVHSLAEAEKCPVCIEKEQKRIAQALAIKQLQERVEDLEETIWESQQ